MRDEPFRRSFRLDLFLRLAEGQSFGLREHIRQEDVVVSAKWVERLVECDEVTGNKPRSLMDQLVKRMLTVGSRFTPVNRAGIAGDFASIKCDVLTVALHCQLLEISRESLQGLLVRKDGYGRRADKIV